MHCTPCIRGAQCKLGFVHGLLHATVCGASCFLMLCISPPHKPYPTTDETHRFMASFARKLSAAFPFCACAGCTLHMQAKRVSASCSCDVASIQSRSSTCPRRKLQRNDIFPSAMLAGRACCVARFHGQATVSATAQSAVPRLATEMCAKQFQWVKAK